MGADTKIEWAHHTFNPWIGCTKVSPACDHCYAETLATARLGVAWGPGAPRRRTAPSTWKQPLAWNRKAEREGIRYRVFCASLADIFDNEVDPAWRRDLFALIQDTQHLDWLLLTKRVGNVQKMTIDAWGYSWLPDHVILGATIANQHEADRDGHKLKMLKQAGVATRTFLSIEPMLGPIVLGEDVVWQDCPNWLDEDGRAPMTDPSTGMQECCSECDFTGIGDELAIDWVVVGGESGTAARPMHPDWPRKLRDQCVGAGIPFMFKQWGEWLPTLPGNTAQGAVTPKGDWATGEDCWSLAEVPDVAPMDRPGKKIAGRLLDGVQHDEVPA